MPDLTAMRDEMEKLVAAGKITHRNVESILTLLDAGYCQHRSWGFGKIAAVETVFGRLTVDFAAKPAHSMDLAFAAESLKPIPKDHILALKAQDTTALRTLAGANPRDLLRIVLRSFGGKATTDQVQAVLVPDVISSDWKRWWENAKRELRKDGHFQIPLKKTEPILYEEQDITLQDRLMSDFRAAKGLKARIAVAAEILKNLADLAAAPAAVQEAVSLLNAEILTHQRTLPALALEAIWMRDDLRQAALVPPPTPGPEPELDTVQVWAQVDHPGRVLEAVAAAKHPRALQSFRQAHPETWAETILACLNSVGAKLCSECAQMLAAEGHLPALKDTLARLISQHTANSELLLWLAKERSDAFADILGPEVFRAMLTAMERDQFNEKKSNRLGDYILNDQELLVELIGTADLEVIKDVTRALQFSPSFDDMDKRSLLARIVKAYPVIQSLISGDHAKQDASLVVSWDSLERRKAEYQELVQKRIPANSKDIAIARSYGDLRENHEYKAAKEQHRLLMRRKAELETQLVRARGSDFANPRTDVVSIGTRVAVTDLETGRPDAFTVLGAWDAVPEQHVISYLSPVGQALLNHAVGETVEFETEGAPKRYRIEAIAAQPPLAQVAPAPTPPPDSAPDPAPPLDAAPGVPTI